MVIEVSPFVARQPCRQLFPESCWFSREKGRCLCLAFLSLLGCGVVLLSDLTPSSSFSAHYSCYNVSSTASWDLTPSACLHAFFPTAPGGMLFLPPTEALPPLNPAASLY